jgi:hypothetical protein
MKAGAPSTFEIILCTARSGDNFTNIVRAQEGTTALSWNAGDTVTLLITAGGLNSFVQALSGSFAANLSGISGSGSFTMEWSLLGNIVTLSSSSGASGTSVGTALVISDIPNFLQPASFRNAPIVAMDNGIIVAASAQIAPLSTIVCSCGVVSGSRMTYSPSGWTASGQKGFGDPILSGQTGFVMSYPLN